MLKPASGETASPRPKSVANMIGGGRFSKTSVRCIAISKTLLNVGKRMEHVA